MSFRRTPSGLSNMHLFLQVDVVVFTEGGSVSYSSSEVLSGAYNTQSVDLLFWTKIFKVFLPKKKLAFRAIGSKSTIKSIASDIALGSVKNVYVATDRDTDNFRGKLIKAPGVFYTFGYSWENDVWCADVVEEAFYTLCPVSRNEVQVRSEINSCYEQFGKDIRWAVYADILLSCHGSSLLPRGKPESVISFEASGKPCVNRQRLRSLIQCKKQKKLNKIFLGQKAQFHPLCDCYGHIVSSFSYRIIVYLLKNNSNSPPLPKDYAYAIGIDKFVSGLINGQFIDCYKHYEGQFLLV
ncbi:hypothetical protein [Coleofasciculus sp. FACHB-SPT36]|uniref:hypothetical protein n=1 Tax=Cyanophyceae TaxID=3028117 RepID=UPI00168B9440|nr:hypothetical protein [Coleofasciculus sp. FACHB-SPT36]MBD2539632.1 hypothetical protein [Coleofasciculus sp. FACHB-SPT36]